MVKKITFIPESKEFELIDILDEATEQKKPHPMKSFAYKLVRKSDNVVTHAGSAKEMRRLRKKQTEPHFVGLSHSLKVGDKWSS